MFTVTVMLDSVEKVQRFVSVISKYSCSFDIESEHSCVDAKSIVGYSALISVNLFILQYRMKEQNLKIF